MYNFHTFNQVNYQKKKIMHRKLGKNGRFYYFHCNNKFTYYLVILNINCLNSCVNGCVMDP